MTDGIVHKTCVYPDRKRATLDRLARLEVADGTATVRVFTADGPTRAETWRFD